MLQITEANVEDAHILGQIQIDAWLNEDDYINPEFGISKEDIRAKTDEWQKMGDKRIIDKLNEVDTKTWVAKIDGKVIGFIGIKESEKEIELEGLFISPKHQRKGVGSELMNKVISTIDKTKLFKLEVINYNKKAISFYHSFGFKEKKEANGSLITLPSGKVIQNIVMIKPSNYL